MGINIHVLNYTSLVRRIQSSHAKISPREKAVQNEIECYKNHLVQEID